MGNKKKHTLKRIWEFYFLGFKGMSKWGKQVWIIILIKLFIMFAVLKIFFFPNFLKTNFENDQDRSDHVLENLTEPKKFIND
jgi:flagellar basal body-associated protein FliL